MLPAIAEVNMAGLALYFPKQRRDFLMCIILSAGSVGVSLAACCLLMLKPSSRGRGISAYDFSTPVAAVRAYAEVELRQDSLADTYLRSMRNSGGIEEIYARASVRGEVICRNGVLLLVSFDVPSMKSHDVMFMKKDARSGMWYLTWEGEPDYPTERESRIVKKWKSESD